MNMDGSLGRGWSASGASRDESGPVFAGPTRPMAPGGEKGTQKIVITWRAGGRAAFPAPPSDPLHVIRIPTPDPPEPWFSGSSPLPPGKVARPIQPATCNTPFGPFGSLRAVSAARGRVPDGEADVG